MVQSDNYLVIINDDESPGFHQVYINGQHPDDPNPAWYGHNTARWEGDTLVVDRIAFDERVWLDQVAHPHSPKLHVIERYRRPDLGHLESEVTVDDPGVLVKPYTIKRVAELAQGYDIYAVHLRRERTRRGTHGRQITAARRPARGVRCRRRLLGDERGTHGHDASRCHGVSRRPDGIGVRPAVIS